MAETLRELSITVRETNNSRIESDGDDDTLSKNGSAMDVDECMYHDTGIENLSGDNKSEKNNDVNYLFDDWKWDHWEPIDVDEKSPGQMSQIFTMNRMVSNLKLHQVLKRCYNAYFSHFQWTAIFSNT